MAHSGKTITFATDLLPYENNIYSLGANNKKWLNIYANVFNGALEGNVNGTATNVTGVVSIENGGTGASTLAEALANLGVKIPIVRLTGV